MIKAAQLLFIIFDSELTFLIFLTVDGYKDLYLFHARLCPASFGFHDL